MSFLPEIGVESKYAASLGRRVAGNAAANHRTRIDAVGPTLSTSTWTLTDPSNATTYAVDIEIAGDDGSQEWSLSILTDGTDDNDDLRDPLRAAIEAESDLMAYIQDITSASGSLVIRAKAGYEITATEVTDSTNDISISNAAAADAPSYTFGRFVEVVDADSPQPSRSFHEGIQALTVGAGPVLSMVVTNDASGVYVGNILYNGRTYPFSAAGNATPATTYSNIKTAIETAFGAALIASDGIVVTAAATMTVAAPLGSLLSADGVGATGGSADLVASLDLGDTAPQAVLVLDDQTTIQRDGAGPVTAYEPGCAVLCADASNGANVYAVASPGAVTRNGDVWVETTSGATKGRAYTVGSASRFKHQSAKWVQVDPQNSSIAHLRM